MMNLLKRGICYAAALAIAATSVMSAYAGLPDGFVFEDGESLSNEENVKYPVPERTNIEKKAYTIEGLDGFIFEGDESENTGTEIIPGSFTAADEKYQLLRALGLVTDAEGDNPNAPYTRAQLSRLAVELMNLPLSGNVQLPFIDIASDDINYAYIAAAYQNGVVDGVSSQYFIPDGTVTSSELAKVLAYALKYQYLLDEGKESFAGIKDTQLCTMFKMSPGSAVTLGEAVSTVYNALDMESAEMTIPGISITYRNGENTLLAERYHVYKERGVLNEIYGRNIYGVSLGNDDIIYVDRAPYFDPEKKASSDLLGRRIILYYSIDPDSGEQSVLLALADEKYKSIQITDRDIDSIKNNTISYAASGAQSAKVRISPDAYVVYNGIYRSLFKDIPAKDTILHSGEMILNEVDGDGTYDVVMVWDYKYFVIDSINTSTKRVFFRNGALLDSVPYLELDEENDNEVFDIYRNGELTTLEDIRDGEVLSVAKGDDSYGKVYYRIYISDEKVSGTLKFISDDSVVIDSKTYKMAYGYENANTSELTLGSSSTYALNHRGEILGIMSSSSYQVGYIVGTTLSSEGGDDDVLWMNLLDDKGEWHRYSCTDKPQLIHTTSAKTTQKKTFKKQEMTELKGIIDSAMLFEGRRCGALIGYTLADDKIKKIYVSDNLAAQNGYAGLDKENFSLDYVAKEDVQMRLYQNTLGARMFANENTKVFFVPSDVSGGVNKKQFRVGSIQMFSNPGDEYISHLRIYEVGEDRVAKYMIVIRNVEEDVDPAGAVMAVESLSYTVTEDDIAALQINGVREGARAAYLVDSPELTGIGGNDLWDSSNIRADELKPGDIIQITTDVYDTIISFRLLFRMSESEFEEKWNKTQDITPDTKMALLHTAYGTVKEKFGNTLIVNCNGDGSNDAYDKAYGTINTSIYICQKSRNGVTIERARLSDVSLMDTVFIRSMWNNTKEIVIFRD
ncbi:MAG: S-layer homology domain-containing protein [Clostridia bacterium]|nr:S-layer homology domain-containing protein [Clostridia bacterium]